MPPAGIPSKKSFPGIPRELLSSQHTQTCTAGQSSALWRCRAWASGEGGSAGCQRGPSFIFQTPENSLRFATLDESIYDLQGGGHGGNACMEHDEAHGVVVGARPFDGATTTTPETPELLPSECRTPSQPCRYACRDHHTPRSPTPTAGTGSWALAPSATPSTLA